MNKLDIYQKQALDLSLNNEKEIIFINGPAGSGKSETIKTIKQELENTGWLVSLTAPTGKASKRIGGTTIHKWLQPEVEEDAWGKPKIVGWKKESFSNKECLIIDESSMLDDKIHGRVMEIYNNSDWDDKKIIMVGDISQLPPVQEGRPFENFINNNPKNGVTLQKIHRQKDGNDIVLFADAIRRSISITGDTLKNVKDVSRDIAIDAVVKDSVNNQIICPMKNGINGVNALNKDIQERIGNEQILLYKHIFVWDSNINRNKKQKDLPLHKGDKIVVTKNFWGQRLIGFDVTNGTTGILKDIGYEYVKTIRGDKLTQVIYFIDDYDGKKYYLPINWLETNIDLAYALTVHKFQGSQCDNIFYMISPDQNVYADKKMHYTAVTRAVKMLYLVKKVY